MKEEKGRQGWQLFSGDPWAAVLKAEWKREISLESEG